MHLYSNRCWPCCAGSSDNCWYRCCRYPWLVSSLDFCFLHKSWVERDQIHATSLPQLETKMYAWICDWYGYLVNICQFFFYFKIVPPKLIWVGHKNIELGIEIWNWFSSFVAGWKIIVFLIKFQFFDKISIFWQNFNFLQIFNFLTKFQFFYKISIFYKFSIFWQNFNFFTNFQFFDKISIFLQIFSFLANFKLFYDFSIF